MLDERSATVRCKPRRPGVTDVHLHARPACGTVTPCARHRHLCCLVSSLYVSRTEAGLKLKFSPHAQGSNCASGAMHIQIIFHVPGTVKYGCYNPGSASVPPRLGLSHVHITRPNEH